MAKIMDLPCINSIDFITQEPHDIKQDIVIIFDVNKNNSLNEKGYCFTRDYFLTLYNGSKIGIKKERKKIVSLPLDASWVANPELIFLGKNSVYIRREFGKDVISNLDPFDPDIGQIKDREVKLYILQPATKTNLELLDIDQKDRSTINKLEKFFKNNRRDLRGEVDLQIHESKNEDDDEEVDDRLRSFLIFGIYQPPATQIERFGRNYTIEELGHMGYSELKRIFESVTNRDYYIRNIMQKLQDLSKIEGFVYTKRELEDKKLDYENRWSVYHLHFELNNILLKINRILT